MASTLVDLLRQRASSLPDGRAYTFLLDGETEEAHLTYAGLDERARAVAALLRQHSAPGERALLLYPPGLDFIAAFFGCLYAGVVAVPAYPPRASRGQQRLQVIARDSQATVALTNAQTLARTETLFAEHEELRALRWLATDETDARLADDWREPALAADALAFLQYTSGSTADPKGVMVTHANILHNEEMIREVFSQDADSVIVGWLPLYHDMGLIGNVLQPLAVGAPSILMSPAAFLQSPVRWLQAISRYRATTSGGPNFAYELCARKVTAEQRAALDLNTWRVAFNGAEPIRQSSLDEFAEAFAPCGFRREAFHPCYGLAEATLLVSGTSYAARPTAAAFSRAALERHQVTPAAPEADDAQTLVGCGGTVGGQRVAVVEPESCAPCAPGRVGEIWVAGPSVAAGYWNRPEQSASTFRARVAGTSEGEFLRTGDLGFVSDGQLFVTGRLKDLIIIRGQNHYPQDIELTAERSHASLRAGAGAAFSVEAGAEERLVLVHEIERTRRADADEVIEAIRRAVAAQHELAAHAVVLVKVGSISKTSSGKIQRHACRARFLEGRLDVVAEWRAASAAGGAADAPHSATTFESAEEIEGWLVAQMAAALGVARDTIDPALPLDSYGLDSLAVTELAHAIEANLGVTVAMASLMRSPSVAEIAAEAIARRRAGDGATRPAAREFADDGQSLSHGQRSLWFLHQLAPESPAYNMAGALRLRGALDAFALRRAFETLTARHPSLRTTFDAVRGEPRRRVHETFAIDWQNEDAASSSEDELHARLAAESVRPFDLTTGPLLRVRLYARASDEHVLLLAAHHIVADFWSLGVLVRELGAAYEAALERREPVFAPLGAGDGGYARAEAEMLAGPAGEKLWSYWRAQLAGEVPALNLPIDRQRPPVQTYNGGAYNFKLDAELTGGLKSLGRERGATLYMTLLAAFEALLYHYTGQEDFAVGSPTSGRNRAALAPLVGYFVNPVVIRARVDKEQTFAGLLDEVRQTALAAFEHQEYPLALLVERLQTARDASRSPLFQTMFVLEKGLAGDAEALAALTLGAEGAALALGPLRAEAVGLRQQIAQFDLTLLVAELDGGLAATLQFNTDLFDASTVERLAGHFRELLARVVAEPQRPVARLSLLSEAEERRALVEWNATRADYPADVCLHQLFEAQTARTPDAVAVSDEEVQLSYRELERRANRLARHLARRGVGAESVVGIYMERSAEMVVALLAALKAGAAYLPLDTTYPQDRVAFMLSDSGARVVLTASGTSARLPRDSAAEVVRLDADAEEIGRESASRPASFVTPASSAYVLYTSGSTGRPKGVVVTHEAICNHMQWMHERFPLAAGDAVLQKTPVSFDASVWEFYAPLMAGGRLVMARPDGHRDPAYIARVVEDEQVHTLQLVPSLLSLLLDEPAFADCRSLRRVYCGGEELTVGLQDKFFARLGGTELCNLYGPTECSIDASYWPCERGNARRRVPLGRPVANTQCYVLDEGRRPAAVGVVGELYIGGRQVARGYHGRPELTAASFVPDAFSSEPGARLYRTGDAARYFADGNLEYVGRIDHQLKLRGFRVELGEIETALAAHPAVRECVVAASNGDDAGKRLVAYVVARDAAPSHVALRAYLKERLPEYMVPSAFVALDALPLTPNGKLDRRALPAAEHFVTEAEGVHVAARTPTEEVLAGVWSEVLKTKRVSVTANFFELGGHSLLATQVASRVREAFGVDVPLRRLFEAPTVEELAAHVETALGGERLRALPPLVPAAREGRLPLSFAQQRLWFLDQLEPDSAAYNMPAAVRLTGALDVAALERALNEIIARHEALRTNFVVVDGEPVQLVKPARRLSLGVQTPRLGQSAAARERQLRRRITEEARRPFDLARGLLLRAKLLRTGGDEHLLLVTMHHIVADGWSTRVFVAELKELYEAFSTGREAALGALPVQYVDYAVWQRRWMQNGALEAGLSYWKRRLEGAKPVLDLPTDRPRSAAQSSQGASHTIVVPAGLTDELRALGRRQGATLFMTLLAAFQTLLHRYTGETDILTGTPVANRQPRETEALIGFFVNTLVMRADLAGDPAFTELLGRVRQTTLCAYEHQDVPFELLVDELRPARETGRTPLFQVMFALQTDAVEQLEVGGLSMSVLPHESAAAKFDLTLSLSEGERGLAGRLEYRTDLFDAETAERCAGHFLSLLRAVADDPARRISELPLLTPSELHSLTGEWNETTAPFPADVCLSQLFERQAAQTPDRLALVYGEEHLTFGELNARANQLAHYLRARGVGAETRVALLMERSAGMIVGLLGVLKAGGAYVPLDVQYPQERIAFMIEDAAASVVLTQTAWAEAVGASNVAHVLRLDDEWPLIARASRRDPRPLTAPDNLAYVIYTSGSTGRPKGVAVRHRAVVNLWTALAATVYAGEAAPLNVAVNAPLAFDSSVKQLIQLLGGHTLCVVPSDVRLERAAMARYLEEHQVDALDCTPSQWKLLFAAGAGHAPRIVLVGGEAIEEATWAQMADEHGTRFFNVYGPTECTVDATLCEVAATFTRPVIGRPLANVRTYVLDRAARPVPIGIPGELCIGGGGLARGYLNDPALTAERFLPDPFATEAGARMYRSGDATRYLGGGELEYLGRLDQQVKVRGHRVELGEIEAALLAHARVREAAVVTFADEDRAHGDDVYQGKRLAAYVVAEGGATLDEIELRRHLQQRLPEYMIPSAFVALGALPLTPNGKLDRRALPAPEVNRAVSERGHVAPRNGAEELLCAMWREALGVERVGAFDNFFDLGGDSIRAAVFVNRLQERLREAVPVVAVFRAPTVAALAAYLEQHHRAAVVELCGEEAFAQTHEASDANDARRETDAASSTEALALGAIEILPREGREGFVLSFAQQRLWFLDQLEPGSSSYNIPAALRLSGPLDIDSLAQSISEVVRRHESLRTRFVSANGEPVQLVIPRASVELPVVDLRHLPLERREETALALAGDEAMRPFDLTRAPLLRARLLRLAHDSHVLLLTLHHIVSDGWSSSLLADEVAALYASFRAGKPSPLAPLGVQYADFAEWQRGQLAGAQLERQLAYWRERLAGAPPALELPTDRPRPAQPSLRGARATLRLSEELSTGLRELARREGATLYMVLLAGFKTLLHRHTGQGDISVGTPVAGRTRRETEELIGFFVNTLVMRTELSGGESFAELLGRVRDEAVGAYAHQDVPFEKLVEELQPERDLSRTPFFQVMFALQNASASRLRLPGLSVERLDVHNATEKFDISVLVEEDEGGLCAVLQYSTDLFEHATISRLLTHYENLLASVVADPARPLADLPMLTEGERHQLLVEWNQTESDYPRALCMHELFEEQARLRPDAVAVVHGEGQVTYRELNRRANRLARHLRRLGVGAETRVGLYLSRTTELVVSMLGILKAGGVYVPLDAQYPPERVAFMLADSEARIVLTERALIDTLPESDAEAVCLDAEWGRIAQESPAPPARVATSDHLAYLIYTSGSTGRPKGVAIEHRAAVAMCAWSQEVFTPSELERTLFSTSICFDLSVYELFVTLSVGGTIVLAANALELPSLAAADSVTLVNTVPSAIAELLRAGGVPRSVRVVNLAGEALQGRLVRRLYEQETIEAVYNLYGPSEDTTYSTWALMAKGSDQTPPIGRPISNTQAYVLDRRLRPVAVGVSGELYLGGAGLSRCYVNRPEATGEKYIPNPFAAEPGARMYRTGDVVRYRPDGVLEYLGRADHQVKVRGFRIELGEVEGAINSHAAVRECVVVARDEADGMKRLVAYVVGRDGATPNVSELRAHLKERLPEYMVPSAFVVLEAMPLTPNGKTDRKALPAPAPAQADGESAGVVAPRTTTEEIVAGIWASVLGLEQVGTADNFFDLGGHSLLATRVVSRVREAFGVELPLRQLFESPTAGELAARVELALGEGRAALVEDLKPGVRAERPALSFAQQRLWFLDQLEPGSTAYNIPAAVHFEGALDTHALEQALGEVVRRHEALRTTFGVVEPVQVINPARPLTLAVCDARALSEVQVRSLVAAEAARPFDLANGPLLRARLLRLGDDEHLLTLTAHHIVSDGWSTGVLIREASALYGAFAAGLPSPLAELPVQYADYADWQRRWLQGDVLEAQLSYWRERLAAPPPALELPTDRARAAQSTNRSAGEPFTIPAALARSLKQLSRAESATFYMVLLAAFKTLLHRYTGETDITVGTPIAGRTRTEFEALIGFFVNTLVMRTDLAGDVTFRELLARVRETALGAYLHQDVPFEKLVEELQPERSLNHTPFFQTMFVLHNDVRDELDMPGVQARADGGASATAKFDLTLVLQEEADGSLSAHLNYNADLFDSSTVRRMAAHYERLLQSAAADPARPLAELSMLTEEEKHQLLVEWNQTASEFPRASSLHELFEEQVRLSPDAVAVVYGTEQVTYRELNRRANKLARHLRRLGVGAETPVAVMLNRSLDLIVSLLGILKAGGVYVPLDAQYPQERLGWMLEDSGARVLLGHRELIARLPEHTARVVSLDTDGHVIDAERARNLSPVASADSLAYVMYTSGSTGRPKGVGVSQRAVARLVKGANYARFAADEVFIQYAPVSFDASTFEVWGALLNGARLVVMPAGRTSLEELGRELVRHEVTTLWLTAGLFHLMVEERLDDLRGVRQLLAGGDVLSPSHVERVLREVAGCRVINGYGPTENTTFTCCHPLDAPEAVGTNVAIGRPISNTEVYVLDKNLRPVPAGVAGELFTGGDGLARGYVNRPELTAERFVPHAHGQRAGATLYRTGDLVRHRADGRLEFLGRIDRQVKIRGFRIEAGEIEAALNEHASVRESVVVVHEPTPGDRQLAAYLVTQTDHAVTPAELRAYLKERLPEYMIPSVFVALAELPLTPNGKVDRRRLPAVEQQEADDAAQFVAPRTPVEEVLAAIWADVLGLRRRVGVEEDFFTLGGHSLLATRVVSRVREALKVELPLRLMFEQPTIAALAASIEKALRGGEDAPAPILPAASRDGDETLSFAQQRLWFLEQLSPGRALYNMSGALAIGGPLDIVCLQQSLCEVVRRHESLRTGFGSIEGRPVQTVSPWAHVALPLVDLQGLSGAALEAEVARLRREEEQRPFDLKRAPLLRARLLRLAHDSHIILLTLHHIVSDGWSSALLTDEVAALYTSYRAGLPSPLAPLGVQYADFAGWQREQLAGGALARQLDYWRGRLEGAAPVLELPTDRPRPAQPSLRGARATMRLDEELGAGLRELARREGATLYMVLLAAFKTLLYRCTGQEDILVGTPVAGRTRRETEELIGFFINTLVMRTDLAGGPSFRELVARVREGCVGAYANQDVPFERLLEELQPERDPSRTPFFQVFFNMLNFGEQRFELPGLELEPLKPSDLTANFDLTLYVQERAAAIDLQLVYDTALFLPARMNELLNQFRHLLAQAVLDPAESVAGYSLITPESRAILPEPTAPLGDEWFGGVHELFAARAARRPSALALTDSREAWTYGELDERSNQLAHYLRAHGVRNEDVVTVYAHRNASLVWAVLGVLKAGAAFLILDPAYPESRLVDYLEMAKPRGLVRLEAAGELPRAVAEYIDAANVACRLDLPARSKAERELFLADYPTTATGVAVGPDDLAYLSFTSGSTGRPKGVMGRQGPLSHFLPWQRETFGLGETDRYSMLSGLAHDPLHRDMFTPLAFGATVCVPDPEKIGTAGWLAAWMNEQRVTVAHLTPAMVQLLVQTGPNAADAPALEVPTLRYAFTVGDVLTMLDVARLRQLAPRVTSVNYYGSTETQRAVGFYVVPPEDAAGDDAAAATRAKEIIPLGRGMKDVQLLVLNNAGRQAGIAETGEIYLRSPHLARGYLDDERLTRERFILNPLTGAAGDRLYRTGDLGVYLPDGNVEFRGRNDFQLKIRGFRIEAGEIEAALSRHPAVQNAVVVAREVAPGDRRLVSYVTSHTGNPAPTDSLRAFLKDLLPDYMIPSAFVALEALPVTPNGKVDRRALPAPAWAETARGGEYVAPRDATEEKLAAIWAEVLGLSRVGIHDNFFDAGGHSLLATQINARVGDAFGVELPLRRLFEVPTVAQLAEAVSEAQREQEETEMRRLMELIEQLSDQEVAAELGRRLEEGVSHP